MAVQSRWLAINRALSVTVHPCRLLDLEEGFSLSSSLSLPPLPCLPPWHRSCFGFVPQFQSLPPLHLLFPFFFSFFSSPFSQHGDLWPTLKKPHKEARLFYATLGVRVLQTGVMKSGKTTLITASLLAGFCNLCRLNLTNDCLKR